MFDDNKPKIYAIVLVSEHNNSVSVHFEGFTDLQDAKDFSCCNYASCLFSSLLELYLVILLHFANADLFPSLYSAAIFFFFNPYPALEP